MGRKKKRPATLEEAQEAPAVVAGIADGGLTEMERERAAIIARNRERLLALGIPSLVTELGGSKAAAAAKKQQKKKPREREGGEDWGPRPKRRRGGQSEQPARRSRRLQQAEEHQREEEENGRQGRSFAAGDTMSWRSRACALPGRRAPLAAGRPTSGHGLVSWWPSCCWTSPVCPRPGPQRRSVLSSCTGAKLKREPREPGTVRHDALAGLTEEERHDRQKVLMARMAQLHLDGLVEMTHDNAKFVVLGSKGNHYTVTLKDDKHTCGCLDYRFRRHHCKHIMLVLSQLGIEEQPQEWHSAVNAKMDELLEQKREREAVEARELPVPRAAAEQVALNFV